MEKSQSAKEMAITMMRILAYNRPYPLTVLGSVPYPPVPGYDVGKVQKLKSLAYSIPVPSQAYLNPTYFRQTHNFFKGCLTKKNS